MYSKDRSLRISVYQIHMSPSQVRHYTGRLCVQSINLINAHALYIDGLLSF